MNRRRMLVLTVSAVAMALVSACGGSGGGQSITVVIAEYSKDHTKPFWQGLSEQYTKQSKIKVDLRIIDWNSIDQQVSTMIQNNQPPDVLNLNSFSSYARDQLLYSADDVLSPKTRDDFIGAFARGGEYQGKLYGFPDSLECPGVLLQPGPLRPRRADRAAEDVGRVRAGRAQDPGAGRRCHRLCAAARARGSPGRVGDLDVEQRRRLEVGRPMVHQQRQERSDAPVPRRSRQSPRVTQINPGKTNRTDGAFQLFKDGKVGMVMGFSPLATQLDGESKVSYGVAEMPTATGQAVTLGVEDYLMAFKKTGQPGGRQAVPRPVLPAREHHTLDHRRGLPAGDEVRPSADGRRTPS